LNKISKWFQFFCGKNSFFYKHAENEICSGLELYLDKEIQADSAHSPQKVHNEFGLLSARPSTSLRVPCSNSGDSHLHPRPERPVYSGHRDVEARRLGLREQRRVGSLSPPFPFLRSSAGRSLCSLTRVLFGSAGRAWPSPAPTTASSRPTPVSRSDTASSRATTPRSATCEPPNPVAYLDLPLGFRVCGLGDSCSVELDC